MLYCNLVDDGIHVTLDFVMFTQVALLKAMALTINASPAADPHTHGLYISILCTNILLTRLTMN